MERPCDHFLFARSIYLSAIQASIGIDLMDLGRKLKIELRSLSLS